MEHTHRGLKTGSTKNTAAQRSSEDKGENCRPLCLEREKKTALSTVAKVVVFFAWKTLSLDFLKKIIAVLLDHKM